MAPPGGKVASAAAYDYFSRLSGITEYGTRVPLAVKRRVGPPGGIGSSDPEGGIR